MKKVLLDNGLVIITDRPDLILSKENKTKICDPKAQLDFILQEQECVISASEAKVLYDKLRPNNYEWDI